MTTTIKTSIAAVAAMFALSGIAHAEGVKISLVGKDAVAIHAEIVKAAHTVCTNVSADSIALTGQSECVADTIAKTEADLRGVSETRLAKADLISVQHGQR
jgi:hypothetical protein